MAALATAQIRREGPLVRIPFPPGRSLLRTEFRGTRGQSQALLPLFVGVPLCIANFTGGEELFPVQSALDCRSTFVARIGGVGWGVESYRLTAGADRIGCVRRAALQADFQNVSIPIIRPAMNIPAEPTTPFESPPQGRPDGASALGS